MLSELEPEPGARWSWRRPSLGLDDPLRIDVIPLRPTPRHRTEGALTGTGQRIKHTL